MSASTKTYRGRSVNELLGQIKADFGDDAVVLAQRETLTGGVGGFFQRPGVELEVTHASQLDAIDPTAEPEPEPAADAPPLTAAQTALLDTIRAAQGIDVRDDDEPAFPPAFGAPEFPPVSAPIPTPATKPVVTSQVPDLMAAFEPAAFEPGIWAAPATPPEPVGPRGSVAAFMPAAPPTRAPATSGAWPADAHAALDALTEAGIDGALGTEIVNHAIRDLAPFASSSDVRALVVQALAERIPVAPLHGETGRVVAFVGPGGSGKTRCVAGIATAYATRSALPVACITLRAKDGGAELQRTLGPAGIPVHIARDAQQARDHVAALRTHSLVLIDTPAVSPRAEAEMRILARELEALGTDEVHLAVPATTGPRAARESIAGAAPLGVTALALTHLDETSELGPSIGLAVESQLPVSFISRGATDTAALRPAVAHELAGALI